MREFKIEYVPDYNNKYQIFRKEPKNFFGYEWVRLSFHMTLDEAEKELKEMKNYPKYYNWK